MKQEDAEKLVADIAATHSKRIKATIVPTSNRGTQYSAVKLLLVPGQRTATIKAIEDWPSVQAVWSLF